jgi:FKBP-type peptidyl-prolyl cis-trans isomerase
VPKGVKVEDLQLGTGLLAQRGDVVHIGYDLFLNQGEHVRHVPDYELNLGRGRRVHPAGLRYGIEGMREGGVRRLRVSPHLAYGEAGLLDQIPPNAVLIFEVRLHQVVKPEVST